MSNIAYFILLLPAIFFMYIVLESFEYIGNKKFFHGVIIEGLNIDEKELNNISKRYKINMRISYLIFVLLLVGELYIAKNNFEFVVNIILLIYGLYITILQIINYFKVKNLKEKYIKDTNYSEDTVLKRKVTIDTRILNEKIRIKNKFKFIFLAILLISVIAILYLAINYDKLPNMIPTDFEGDSTPTDYVTKSFKVVFGLELTGFLMISLLSFIGITCLGNISSIKKEKLENSKDKIIKYINKIGNSFVLIVISVQFQTTFTPIFLFKEFNLPMITLLISWFLIGLGIINIAYAYIMLSSYKVKEKTDYSSDDAKWIFGYYYYNKEDPRLIVESRRSAGWNINWGSQSIKVVVATILLYIVFKFTMLNF